MKSKILSLLFFFVLLFLISGYIFDFGYLFHGIRCTYLRGETSAQIDDGPLFYSSVISAGKNSKKSFSSNINNAKINGSIKSLLEKSKTVSFLILQNDSIDIEKYWDIGSKNSNTNSFSMAKSIISLLVGCAIDDGFIQSVEQNVCDFFQDVCDNGGGDLKIKHLLQMTSGMDWLENYKRPLSVTAKAYYGTNLKRLILDREFKDPPGVFYEYKSGDTQLLGLILEKATKLTVSEYASKKIWSKIGAENDAFWTLDYKGGVEKVFCCFYSNARDFSKIGKLVLNNGIINGDTVISSNYIKWLLSPVEIFDRSGEKVNYYRNSWWYAIVDNKEIFYARGYLGQYIVTIPELNLVFVRLGKKEKNKNTKNNNYDMSENLEFLISEIIKLYS